MMLFVYIWVELHALYENREKNISPTMLHFR